VDCFPLFLPFFRRPKSHTVTPDYGFYVDFGYMALQVIHLLPDEVNRWGQENRTFGASKDIANFILQDQNR
jgi:hypothetical protein